MGSSPRSIINIRAWQGFHGDIAIAVAKAMRGGSRYGIRS
jgi:hypothetical protein